MTETTTRGTKLTQIVAIAGGVKTRAADTLTDAYKQIQKPAPFRGIARTYSPKDDEGERLPPESTQVQLRVEDLIAGVKTAMGRMLDVVATQDTANARATADLIVDGTVLLENAPVTYLIWLEKQIVNLRTFISKLPILDVAEHWTYDVDAKAWKTDPTETVRTKKIPRNHVVAKATERHPEQVQVYNEDVPVGYWKTVHFSGAVPASTVFELTARAETLLDAVRFAREQANMLPVVDVRAGDPILDYLFR